MEVLVAITILLVGLVGPLTIASTGLKNATFAREQNIAFFLAQEGIEAIIYLREEAGLANVDDNSEPTWDWVSDIPSECFDDSPCQVDVTTYTITECNPISECDLTLYDTGTVRYRHGGGGEATPFRRMLYFENTDDSTLRVRSIVEWTASAYGTNEDVVLDTFITDIYDD